MSKRLYALIIVLIVFVAVETIYLSSVKENKALRQVRFTSVYADELYK